MASICDKVKQFFRDINIKKSCVSSCCNTEIIVEEHKHHKHHKNKHHSKDIKTSNIVLDNLNAEKKNNI